MKKRVFGFRAATLASFFILSGIPSSAAEFSLVANIPRFNAAEFVRAPNVAAVGPQTGQPIELPEAASAPSTFPASPQPNDDRPSVDAWFEHVGGVLPISLVDACSAPTSAVMEELESQYDGRSREPNAERPVSLQLAGGTYRAVERRGKDGPLLHASAFHLRDGVLSASHRSAAEAAAPVRLDLDAEFNRAIAIFGPGVRAVSADVGNPADAAWLARRASAAGFTRVLRDSRNPDPSLRALFVRPEDVVVDRAGHEWRRTKIKGAPVVGTMPKGPLAERMTPRFVGGKLTPFFMMKKELPRLDGGILERYQNGDRVHSLLRYESPNSITILEYDIDYKPGAYKPEPGTPADRMAIFWLKNKRLQIHLSLNASGVLDPDRELRAAAARFGPRLEAIDARLSPDSFRRLLARGFSPEQAALRGWIGRFAAESGFMKVFFAPGALENLRSGDDKPVLVSFARPG